MISMQIDIQITSKRPKKINNVLSYGGLISIGMFSETIVVPVDLWTKEDYERQWKYGLERIKTKSVSCLVTYIHNPQIRPFLEWWILYKVGDYVCVQNVMYADFVYKEEIGNKPFTPETCYDFIPPRITEFEDGGRPSEWCVPFESE